MNYTEESLQSLSEIGLSNVIYHRPTKNIVAAFLHQMDAAAWKGTDDSENTDTVLGIIDDLDGRGLWVWIDAGDDETGGYTKEEEGD